MYNEEDFLLLSGLQHFAFCRRQWALIHIENQWAENYRTVDGNLLHQNVHDPSFSESRGDLLIRRAVRIYSSVLGLSGECDAVEFRCCENGISLPDHPGLWQPYPVEYKRGRPGTTEGDALQLCAQAICLEEMLCCTIPSGALYYGEIRHREKVDFTDELKEKVHSASQEMHDYYRRSYTPSVKPHKGCNACSLKDLCLPKLMRKKPVSDYLKKAVEEA